MTKTEKSIKLKKFVKMVKEILSNPSSYLLFLCLILGILNLIFINHHGNLHGAHKKPRHVTIRTSIETYQRLIYIIGLIILFLLATSCIIDPGVVNIIVGPYIGIRVLIPFFVWCAGYYHYPERRAEFIPMIKGLPKKIALLIKKIRKKKLKQRVRIRKVKAST